MQNNNDMSKEIKIKDTLESKFGFMKDSVVVKRQLRVNADVPMDKIVDVIAYALDSMGFKILITITGMDEGKEIFGVVYHLSNDGRILLNLKVHVPRSVCAIKTITHLFPNADIYERELIDLLGLKVEGLAPGNRYPLHDNWPEGQYPLRKEWKSDKPVECQGGTKCIIREM